MKCKNLRILLILNGIDIPAQHPQFKFKQEQGRRNCRSCMRLSRDSGESRWKKSISSALIVLFDTFSASVGVVRRECFFADVVTEIQRIKSIGKNKIKQKFISIH